MPKRGSRDPNIWSADGTARRCSGGCGQWKPATTQHFERNDRKPGGIGHRCLACVRAYENSPKRRERRHRHHLRKVYALTPAEYGDMELEQGGVCAICRRPCHTGQRLSVDHDHATGQVRGLLCRNCNTALGLADDNPDRLRVMARYVEQFRAQHGPTS